MSAWDEDGAGAGDGPPLEVDDRALGLLRAAETFSRELRVFLDHALSPFELGMGEYEVLSMLRSIGPPHRSSPGELASRLARTSGAMSKRIAKLVGRGWVAREPDPEDGRGAVVSLTAAGLDVERRVLRTVVAALSARLRDGAGEVEPDAMARALQVLARDLGA